MTQVECSRSIAHLAQPTSNFILYIRDIPISVLRPHSLAIYTPSMSPRETTVTVGKVSSLIRDLGIDHAAAFAGSVTELLSTDIAAKTYAEIIDGIPTADTWYAFNGKRHDIIKAHHELLPGTLGARA